MTRLTTLMLLGLLPLAAAAAVAVDDIPNDSTWYLHADLAGMRDTSSGRDLYGWLEGEVFVELNEEIGIDVNEEVDRVTAYSDRTAGIVAVIEGPLRREARDRMLALVALQSRYEIRSHGDHDYYFAGNETPRKPSGRPLDDLGDSLYFSFALPGKLIVTSREQQMRTLLERQGRIPGGGGHSGALLVLSADRAFVQAGLRTEELAEDAGDGWDSNILRNTEQAALLIADRDGLLAVEAQLRSRDPRMAQSLHSVINGLISLQVFNSELDPELVTLINNTRVSVRDAVLSISTVFDAGHVARLLAD